MLGEVITELLFRNGFPRLRHHDRGQLFTQPFMRKTKNGCLIDRIVLVDDSFDFGAVDVLTTSQHHVLLAVNNIQ